MDDREWLEALYNETYALLCRVGRAFLGNTPAGADRLEDEIQEVFLLAYARREKLQSHPCPEGWLVEALRRRLLSYYRAWRREQGRFAFSLNEEGAREPVSPETDPAFMAAADKLRLQALEKLLGREDAQLFTLYCLDRVPAKELTERFSMTEACIRVRAGRIRQKILRHPELFLSVALVILLRF